MKCAIKPKLERGGEKQVRVPQNLQPKNRGNNTGNKKVVDPNKGPNETSQSLPLVYGHRSYRTHICQVHVKKVQKDNLIIFKGSLSLEKYSAKQTIYRARQDKIKNSSPRPL